MGDLTVLMPPPCSECTSVTAWIDAKLLVLSMPEWKAQLYCRHQSTVS